jgi:hypothetical protein
MKRVCVLAVSAVFSLGPVLLAGSAASAAVAHTKRTYPAAVQRAFMGSCKASSNGNASACRCILTYVEQHATLAKFEADVNQIQAGATPKILKKAAAAC